MNLLLQLFNLAQIILFFVLYFFFVFLDLPIISLSFLFTLSLLSNFLLHGLILISNFRIFLLNALCFFLRHFQSCSYFLELGHFVFELSRLLLFKTIWYVYRPNWLNSITIIKILLWLSRRKDLSSRCDSQEYRSNLIDIPIQLSCPPRFTHVLIVHQVIHHNQLRFNLNLQRYRGSIFDCAFFQWLRMLIKIIYLLVASVQLCVPCLGVLLEPLYFEPHHNMFFGHCVDDGVFEDIPAPPANFDLAAFAVVAGSGFIGSK